MLAIDFPFYVKVRDWSIAGEQVMLVEVSDARGSTPREFGAAMAVSASDSVGTIGGGRLEWLAIAEARKLIATQFDDGRLAVPLGPEIGQCCGGRIELRFTRLDDRGIAELEQVAKALEASRPHVFIFGAGHTGRALSAALSLLPLQVSLIDSRQEAFENLRTGATHVLTPLPEAIVARAPPGSAFVTMTHEHSLDFLITAEALTRDDVAYCGMIGSKTKRAVFVSWLGQNGYPRSLNDRLVCPIGGEAVKDKRPEIIAAMTAAEILASLHVGSGESIR
jgi:xanthine dehydrogenase accessory factor